MFLCKAVVPSKVFSRLSNHCSIASFDDSHFLKFRIISRFISIKLYFVHDAQALKIFRFTPVEVAQEVCFAVVGVRINYPLHNAIRKK